MVRISRVQETANSDTQTMMDVWQARQSAETRGYGTLGGLRIVESSMVLFGLRRLVF